MNISALIFLSAFIIHISCLYSTPAARNEKSEQFWSGRVALHGKEAGNLQQSRKKNTCANRNGEAQLPQEQKDDIQGQKPCGHDSGNLLKSSAFFFVKFSCLIIDGTAKFWRRNSQAAKYRWYHTQTRKYLFTLKETFPPNRCWLGFE